MAKTSIFLDSEEYRSGLLRIQCQHCGSLFNRVDDHMIQTCECDITRFRVYGKALKYSFDEES